MTILWEHFNGVMNSWGPWEECPHIAVALSGGADSTALCLLMHQWCVLKGGAVSALIVDHQLSCEEALQVKLWAQERGIKASILLWDKGPDIASGIQEKARYARYALLREEAKAQGIVTVALGHNRDEQWETLKMRYDSGSHLYGLAGMPAHWWDHHVCWIRPLLQVPRDALRDFLKCQGETWFEDPMNYNAAFYRARMRQDQQGLSSISWERRKKWLVKRQEMRSILDRTAHQLIAERITPLPWGGLKIHIKESDTIMPWSQVRLFLWEIVSRVHGGGLLMRHDRVLRHLWERIKSGMKDLWGGKVETACSCIFGWGKEAFELWCVAEVSKNWRKKNTDLIPLPQRQSILWNGRWFVSGFEKEVDIGPMPENRVQDYAACLREFLGLKGRHAYYTAAQLPVLWRQGKLWGLPYVPCLSVFKEGKEVPYILSAPFLGKNQAIMVPWYKELRIRSFGNMPSDTW